MAEPSPDRGGGTERPGGNELIVPEPTAFIDQYEAHEHVQGFFDRVLDHVGLNERARKAYTERKTYLMYWDRTEGGDPVEVDDRANVLVVREHAVASAIEWRDQGNFTRVLFASYLNEELVARLRDRPELLERDIK